MYEKPQLPAKLTAAKTCAFIAIVVGFGLLLVPALYFVVYLTKPLLSSAPKEGEVYCLVFSVFVFLVPLIPFVGALAGAFLGWRRALKNGLGLRGAMAGAVETGIKGAFIGVKVLWELVKGIGASGGI